ncbi:hypothetical protein ACTXG7_03690 [Mycolicibacterium sp. Dal123E01]|uniref:hypothetical protein n=1 Tax=Mycolicibacterium sp. Dal123E01 TaxID=3457578 RepID=UPI00403E7A68
MVIAAMAASVVVLGMSAYWRCHGDQTAFFAPLTWTLTLFVGNVEKITANGVCAEMPIALEIARLFAIATTLTAALAAALTLFRSQVDRIAIRRARSLTVVVGIDAETVSMVRAIARTLNPAAALVVLTNNVESDAAHTAQALGARLRTVKLTEPDALSRLPLWKRLDRLYLLSADPVENLKRFNIIDAEVTKANRTRRPLPLTVRIDDPWQAEVWRRSFLMTAERGWVADAVGRYEVTAAKLVRHMTTQRRPAPGLNPPKTVVLCGLYPLTYAMASELAQLQREQQLYEKPDIVRPSRVVIFAKDAQSFVDDHRIRQGYVAPDGTLLPVAAHDEEPSVDVITKYLRAADPASHAIVLGDPAMAAQATRLASRFPELRVYAASATSKSLVDFSIVGHLYSFPIDMELTAGAPQDVWERAAELIHELYCSGTPRNTPATRPWQNLHPFIKQSNRRQLANALWMVESLANRTWNILEQPGPADPLPEHFMAMDPLEQLKILGFDDTTVATMVEAEHEDWRKYYESQGWTYNKHRDDARQRHDRLLPWREYVKRHPEDVHKSRKSLATTLINLRTLGYRSEPKTAPPQWRQYRRHGEVTAEKRDSGWTWKTRKGEIMNANPGDWAVTDDQGNERSVAPAIFESTHQPVGPRRYQRTGTVFARQATQQEVIETLEGNTAANKGDWIVKGANGEMWPVPNEQFLNSYEGPFDE